MGGYRAVCTTDFIQGALIFVAFVATSIIMISIFGGVSGVVDNVNSFAARASNGDFGALLKEKFLANKDFGIMSAVSAFAWCLGYFGMPHIIVRFMGIRSNAEIKKARRIGVTWMIVAYIGAFIIGTVGTAYLFKNGLILGPGAEAVAEGITNAGDADTVFSLTMNQMYPAFIAGIFLCAILAAAMSTADSQLLSASSAIGQDIYKGIINKNASDKSVLNVSRVSVFAIAVVGLLLSLDPESSIFSLVSFAWSGFGGTFGPLIILALFWRKATAKGAIAGLICGGIMDVVWHYLPADKCAIFGLYEILPAFVTTLLVTVIVSLFDKNKNPEMIAQYDAYKNMKD